MHRNKIIVVCGPTASGKSDAAIEIAKKFGTEIVSADSMQIYTEMNIGTAKPDMVERCGVAHHMFDVVSVEQEYNVTRFVKDATVCIDNIISEGKAPVLVGGTGLYIDSLVNNTKFSSADVDIEYRNRLFDLSEKNGVEYIHSMLAKADPEAAEKIHQNNVKRVIRALEIIRSTGKTIAEVNLQSKQDRKYDPVFIGLNFRNRALLYERIDHRVDLMLKNGLIDEAKKIYSLDLSETSRAAIGYKELFSYFNGELSLDDAVELIKKNSRNYAKRQLTWFNRNKEIKWFYRDDFSDIHEINSQIIDYILNIFEV